MIGASFYFLRLCIGLFFADFRTALLIKCVLFRMERKHVVENA